MVGEGYICDGGGIPVVFDGSEAGDVVSFVRVDSGERRQGARLPVVDDSEIADHDVEFSRVRCQVNPSATENRARVVAECVERESAFRERAGDDSVRHSPQIRDEAWLHGPDEPPRARLAPGRLPREGVRVVRDR